MCIIVKSYFCQLTIIIWLFKRLLPDWSVWSWPCFLPQPGPGTSPHSHRWGNSPQPCYNPHFKQCSETTVIAATDISKHYSPQPCYNPHFKQLSVTAVIAATHLETLLSATLLQSTFQTKLSITTVIAATDISIHFSLQPCHNPLFKELSVTTVISATDILKHFSPQPCYNPHFRNYSSYCNPNFEALLSATLQESTFQNNSS